MLKANKKMTPVSLPISKSIANRRLILDALVGNEINLPYPLKDLPNDVVIMQRLLFNHKGDAYDVEDAGTVFRFLCAYLSQKPGTHRLFGTEKLNGRPIAPLVDALRVLGADIDYEKKEGSAPLIIRGRKLEGKIIAIEASHSSQFVSALMLIAPTLSNGLTLRLEMDSPSFPYIEITQECLNKYGVKVNVSSSSIQIDEQEISPNEYPYESDWSSAAFWYSLSAVSQKPFLLSGLSFNSIQGDKACADYFTALGFKTNETDEGVEILPGYQIQDNSEFHLKDHPDLAPALIVACALKKVNARFKGLETLKYKESDRTAMLQMELKKINVDFHPDGEDWILDSVNLELKPVTFNPHNDHRLAMAFAAIKALEPRVIIEDPLCVKKSYPQFWDSFNNLFL